MKINKKSKKILVTHDGSFHTDDIFAAAILSIYLESIGESYEIIRTRDQKIIDRGDYVFDVGGIYDKDKNRFDHHQTGGAGSRAIPGKSDEKGLIEYASVGLVWNKFGIKICGSQKVFDTIEQRVVLPIDAFDNGINLYENNFENIFPYTINDVMSIFSPTALEDGDRDKQFMKALGWAREILEREIKKASDQGEITKIIRSFYEKAKDKRLIVVERPKVSRFEIWEALQEFPEPLFVVYGDKGDWSTVEIVVEEVVVVEVEVEVGQM
ncbi:MAG: MYG1 family protein, partial [Patescibacteria group bacterium]